MNGAEAAQQTASYIALSPLDLVLAALLLLINAGISFVYRLGIERTLLLNTARMIVQLVAIGFVLKFVFAQSSPLWTIALGLVMIAVAAYEVRARQTRALKGIISYGLSGAAMLFIGTVLTVVAVAGFIGPDPWYTPQYVLPILGMLLGNTMTGIALALDTVTSAAHRDRDKIEARLALGATRREAFDATMRAGLKTGLMPIINAMAAAGIVSLPGMMTGQILSGVDPIEAAKYQLLIMFFIAGATAIGVFAMVIGGLYILTDERARLRLDRLEDIDT